MNSILWSLALLCLTSLTAAQNATQQAEQQAAMRLLASMPKCGLICLETAIAESPCSSTDIGCSCRNATITTQVEQCVAQSCSIKDSLTTKNSTSTLCQVPVRDHTRLVSYSGVIGCIIALVVYVFRMSSKVFSPCTTGGRCYTDLWWDDAFITLAMILIVPLSAISVLIAKAGLGKDIWTLPFENITHILKIYYFDEDLYLSALPAVKISILCTYLRIFQSKRFRYAVWIMIALNFGYGIAFVLISVFQCRPISYAWTHWDGEHVGSCNNINAQGWASAALNVVLDFLTIGLPIPMIWSMSLNKRKKFLVLLMFCVGFFVTIVSILRLQVLIEFGDSNNITWDYTAVGYWSTIELHASVVCACMPALRQLIRRFAPRLVGSTAEESKMGRSQERSGASNLSGVTAVNSTRGKEADAYVRPRRSDEHNFIPLDNVTTKSDSQSLDHRNGRSSPYHAHTQSGQSWFAESRDEVRTDTIRHGNAYPV